jgi:ribosomal protein L37AE/L43A
VSVIRVRENVLATDHVQLTIDRVLTIPRNAGQMGVFHHTVNRKDGNVMANQVGKRYVCKKCGAEFIVTRGGNGTVHCCGQPMELKK